MKRIPILAMVTICTTFVLTWGKAIAGHPTVLATTFPIYQIVRNVTQERDGLKVDLMLPSQMGCPHDYALTPQDMRKLAKADILVVNGLGMEEFLGAPVQKANPHIKVIDSSSGINETIQYTAEEEHDHDAHVRHAEEHHEHESHHHHNGVNPHLFASPRMTARLVMNIATGLAKADPDGAAIYFKNAKSYAATMNQLADDMAAIGKHLKNNRVVQPHGVFDYLARDMGLEIVALMQAHGQEPAAAEMMQIIQQIKEKRAGAIFTEPQYSDKVGKTLAQETGIPVAVLDPVATGPEDAPLSYYDTVMRQNMETIESTLGIR